MEKARRKGNEKTLHNFYNSYPEYTETWFCNADEHANVFGDVEFEKNGDFTSLFIPELESYLNPSFELTGTDPNDEAAWQEYMHSEEWERIVRIAFDFFTR